MAQKRPSKQPPAIEQPAAAAPPAEESPSKRVFMSDLLQDDPVYLALADAKNAMSRRVNAHIASVAAREGIPGYGDPTPREPPPQDHPQQPNQTDETPRTVDRSDWYRKSYLRLAANRWQPPSKGDAKAMALECVYRAEALASVLAETASHGDMQESDVRNCLELLSDLLHIPPILDWWDDEDDLLREGWQPPQAQEGQS